jgi:hypothetical protein
MLSASVELTNNYLNMWIANSEMDTAFYVYLAENATEQDLQIMFNGYINCGCCEPHRGSSPVSYNSDEMTPIVRGQKCACPCRHTRRNINRAFKHQVWLNNHTL